MDVRAYPGKGLSLSQLIFALNEELKRVAYCSSFAFDVVSQLDKDASTALATLREWRNSFVLVNRIPSEVLSLVPTHLPYENDISNASSVCRHWRRTFTRHAVLWSRLDLAITRSSLFVKTVLERAKGTPLDIRSARLDCADTLALISPRSRQLKTLEFVCDHWSDIQRFSEAISGPLPLLRTLKINVVGPDMLGPETMNPPTLPLFSGALNLKEFIFRLEGEPFLSHFAFPNLTTLDLSAVPEEEIFPTSQLLDFLEASPTLRTVRVGIEAEVSLANIPPERVVVLPNVETFSLTQDEPGYGIAAHISCPSARLTSLIREHEVDFGIPRVVFPTSVSWNVISPQHVARPTDEAVLGITTAGDTIVSSSLSFVTPGPVTFRLGYRMVAGDEYHSETRVSLGEKHSEVVSQAFGAILEHPLLSNIKRLRIWDRHLSLAPHHFARVMNQAARFFKSVGPLEELTLDVTDLRLYLAPFFDLPEFRDLRQLAAFPAIKGLTIAEQSGEPLTEECAAAIVELAKSQHELGVPFERVMLHTMDPPAAMVARLEPWVGTVRVDEDMIIGDCQDLV